MSLYENVRGNVRYENVDRNISPSDSQGGYQSSSQTMSNTRNEKTLVYQVESDILEHSHITKLSRRSDPRYFTGRAGIVRILTLILSSVSVALMTRGYYPVSLDNEDPDESQIILMMKSNRFSGYGETSYTLSSIAFGGCTVAISGTFILLLYLFLEVRCDLIWERINQRAHVLACILSVAAAFCDVMSIQKIQEINCNTLRCKEEVHNTKNLKFEEPYFPPYFIAHYVSFVGFLINAMLYSIASRIWLRNDD